jgi:hypothetical protein
MNLTTTTTEKPQDIDYLSLESPPPTVEEQEQILSMRKLLGGDDGPLLKKYKNYDEIISVWAFLRYLRGRDHNVEDAVKVFKDHLAVREEYNLNEIREKVINTRFNYDASDFENGKECISSMPLTYNAGVDPTYGHVLCYIPIGAQDTYKLEKSPGFDTYLNFCLHEWIARDIQLTKLSIKHNRLIKLILIIDLGGLSLTSSQVTHSKKKQFDKDWQKILETKPENTARWYFINVPWFGVKMYNTFGKMTFPTNTIKKISLFGSDFRQQLLKHIDISTLTTLIKSQTRRASIKGNEEDDKEIPLSDNCLLKAGEHLELLVEITSNVEKVKWSVNATVRDVKFGCKFYRTSAGPISGSSNNGETKNQEENGTQEDVIVNEYLIHSKAGEVIGEHIIKNNSTGLMIFSFSNKQSWMRSNGVDYRIEVIKKNYDGSEREDEEEVVEKDVDSGLTL